MNVRQISRKVYDWIFRPAELREARTALPPGDAEQDAAARQAKLLLEVARRTAEPAEPLPPGALPAVLFGIYRDAIHWALAARRPDRAVPAGDLGALWDASAALPSDGPPPLGSEDMAALRKALIDDYAPRSLAVTTADATRAQQFAEAVIWELDAPRRRVERVLVQRWLRIGLLGVVLLGLVIVTRVVILGPNLAEGKPFRTSTTFSGWGACVANNGCHGLLFHTENENNPWVEFDLGAPTKVKRVEVVNRGDCCADRAAPMVVEVGNDRINWTAVARRDTPFGSWTASFSSKVARYVRLRVPRQTVLHLQSVVVR
jgi:hypothetical protein